ncbi:DNA-processing protein DprA [Lactococcus termiticola]|uniref:DNA processing protein n=1 Tax=Lactococcus termiticola TaxID=2169526 RepID=A0A2R5HKQ8_9LACT|nr:DNA-processing protein DprA [Lactococcus termiticola]GBG97211.1 DNA processing protein [Lactococcus termiticola]
MTNNFDIFRWKMAGLSNRSVNRILDFLAESPQKLPLRRLAEIGQPKSTVNFIEGYKSQDVKDLRKQFSRFPSFSILDEAYPERLRQIYDPPTLLFYLGNLKLLEQEKIAFVGSREASSSAMKSTQNLISGLNGRFVIVSGLARGIDTASHLSAIKSKSGTIAVIGTGLDQYYPEDNRKLQDHISRHELLLSEYPAGSKALKYHFPERNRIIAGLSKAVVVIEAKRRSGSLITAERAMEEGRDVFAVPGDINEARSEGCHHLIQEGAKLVYQPKDIIEEYES